MFGKRKDKLYLTLTVDDSVDMKAVRDYLIDVVFRKMIFIRHASASFGMLSHNVAAEDYETTRAYESIPEKVVRKNSDDTQLEQMKLDLADLQEQIDERTALG